METERLNCELSRIGVELANLRSQVYFGKNTREEQVILEDQLARLEMVIYPAICSAVDVDVDMLYSTTGCTRFDR